MKNKWAVTILIIIYSIVLIPIWGFTLLDAMANEFTVLACFIFTFFSGWFIAKNVAPNINKNSKYLILIGPIFYFIVFIVIRLFILKEVETFWLFPILWIFVFSLAAVFFKEKYFTAVGINALFLAYFYAFNVYPTYRSSTENFSSESFSEKKELQLNTTYNLADFKFINSKLDTVTLSSEGKPILIETWRETCKPCLQSINDLQEFLSNNKSINQVYLYEQRRGKDFSKDMVFNFPKIKDKDKILVDINNEFMDKLGMPSYPYFLLFDKEGKLVDYISGYKPEFKEEYINKFKEMFQAVKLEKGNENRTPTQ